MTEFDTSKLVRLDGDINALKVEVSSLREKVAFFNVIYGKFDDTLNKVQTLMENRRNETNDDLRDVYQKIQDTENKIMTEIKALRNEMTTSRDAENNKMNTKIESLDKWRWQMMGGAAVIGFLLSKAADFFK
jgi:DNA anti-recombination protein RmuC